MSKAEDVTERRRQLEIEKEDTPELVQRYMVRRLGLCALQVVLSASSAPGFIHSEFFALLCDLHFVGNLVDCRSDRYWLLQLREKRMRYVAIKTRHHSSSLSLFESVRVLCHCQLY